MPRAVFVYGTLKRAQCNHRFVAHATHVEPATTRGALFETPHGYPALLVDGDGEVHGELLRFDDLAATLAVLDAFEGYDPRAPERSEYVRVAVTVHTPAGAPQAAWAYVFTADRVARVGARAVPGPVWPPVTNNT